MACLAFCSGMRHANGLTQALTWLHGCTGTERCHEAVCKLKAKHDIVVNIQGDEPLVEPAMIDEVVEALKDSPEAVFRSAP